MNSTSQVAIYIKCYRSIILFIIAFSTGDPGVNERSESNAANQFFTLSGTTDSWSLETKIFHGIYITYGVIFCLCILIGTSGNLFSFLYFKSKKKSLSTTIYMLISANDMVVSMTAIPLALTDLSRSKGLMRSIFGYEYGKNNYRCVFWKTVWEIAIKLSVYLTTCLSVSRTFSLFDPFRRQKVKSLFVALLIFAALQSVEIILFNFVVNIGSNFGFWGSHRCNWMIFDLKVWDETAGALVTKISNAIFLVIPAFAVAISSVMSVVVLVQSRRKTEEKQRVLEASRNRATITILLFALLYGICNTPLIVEAIIRFLPYEQYQKMLEFDEHFYYQNAAEYLLLAVNSAANPIFYFWRMPALRESVKADISSRVLVKTPKLVKSQTDITKISEQV